MKFIFFGTPEFAAIILKHLIDAGFVPAAVVCNPDRPVGRKKILTPPPTKVLASKHNVAVIQPESLEIRNLKLEIEKIKSEVFDFFVVAAYAKIIPKEILDIPRLGTIGVHPSLLPKYRGASPIQSAVLAGEKETGITLYILDDKMDHGPMLASGKWQVASGIAYDALLKELAELGGNLLVETLPKFLNDEITPRPQNEAEATYTKKFKIEDAFIDPADLEIAQKAGGEIALQIERKTRALNPEPGVWTTFKRDNAEEKRIKLLGTGLKNGKLILNKIQVEGEKPKELTK